MPRDGRGDPGRRSRPTNRADGSRLKSLLENLSANAVDHGGDDVTITVEDVDGVFYVGDDGPCIPTDQRDQVLKGGYSTT